MTPQRPIPSNRWEALRTAREWLGLSREEVAAYYGFSVDEVTAAEERLGDENPHVHMLCGYLFGRLARFRLECPEHPDDLWVREVGRRLWTESVRKEIWPESG